MKLGWQGYHEVNWSINKMAVRLLLLLYFVSLLDSLHSQNFCRKVDTTSIPTIFVGTVIPKKLLGTVYFDKSCLKHGMHVFLTNVRRSKTFVTMTLLNPI